MTQYYVTNKKETAAKLLAIFASVNACIKARMEFVKKHMPGFESVNHYGGHKFTINFPRDKQGVTKIPEYMKFVKNGRGMETSPLKKTAKGREIAKLMEELPEWVGGETICDAIGLKPMQIIGGQIRFIVPGLSILKGKRKGQVMVRFESGAKYDPKGKGLVRISDTLAEKLLPKKDRDTDLDY